MNKRLGGRRRRLLIAAVAILAILAILLRATNGNGGGAGLWFLLLLVLVCPLMMLFMMGSMHYQADSDEHQRHIASGGDLPDLEDLTREEQMRRLRAETARMNWRQETLRQDLERLEQEHPADRGSMSGAQ